MIYLTIINTIAILYLFHKTSSFSFIFKKVLIQKKIAGFDIKLYRKQPQYKKIVFQIRIPFKNIKKAMHQVHISELMSYSNQARIQVLSAKFSFLKTWEQVYDFEKKYIDVDRKTVERLVSNFKPRN